MAKPVFWPTQPEELRQQYIAYLRGIAALSRLFSEARVPFLHYRGMERSFCLAFSAIDLSRSDVSVDARLAELGIGLKTFLRSSPSQKIAEFNEAKAQYEGLHPEKMIRKIAELRNERLSFTANAFKLNKTIYHCILRDTKGLHVVEEPMEPIAIANIGHTIIKKGTISFSDGKHEYSFYISKSTLYKRFIEPRRVVSYGTEIIENPFELLRHLATPQGITKSDEKLSIPNFMPIKNGSTTSMGQPPRHHGTVYLPLYSARSDEVEARSGLNQWNASGRPRDPDEAYIPVPAIVHRCFPGFFPERDVPFQLKLPNGTILDAKMCQEGRKGLMSNPNKSLGHWLLRVVLNLKEGKLLTRKKLDAIGIDSVRVDKLSEKIFEINFSRTGSYAFFANEIIKQ